MQLKDIFSNLNNSNSYNNKRHWFRNLNTQKKESPDILVLFYKNIEKVNLAKNKFLLII